MRRFSRRSVSAASASQVRRESFFTAVIIDAEGGSIKGCENTSKIHAVAGWKVGGDSEK